MLQQVVNGNPTDPQARPLFEHIRAMIAAKQEGVVLSHAQIESLIGVRRAAQPARYRTIVGVVRKRVLRELGYQLKALMNVGYEIPSGAEQVRQGVGLLRRASRRLRSSAVVIGAVQDERLTETERKNRDFAASRAAYLAQLASTEHKSVQLTLGKTEALPPPK